jgi:hypothetical protein
LPDAFPDFSGNACAGFDDDERSRLRDAALILADSGSVVVKLAAYVGKGAEWAKDAVAETGAKVFGDGWQDKVQEVVEVALWRANDLATVGLEPEGERQPWDWFNKAVVTTTGGVTGFFGLPGALVDVPITTLMIMRSVAEIARSQGEDLGSDDAKRACIQVFAFGGPEAGDDDAEVGYWLTRAGLTHGAIEVLIRQVVRQFSVAVSDKLIATAVPFAGAFAGGALNYAFMDFYQDMARVHFTLRALERRHGDEGGVRACFDALVRQARERKRLRPVGAASNEA